MTTRGEGLCCLRSVTRAGLGGVLDPGLRGSGGPGSSRVAGVLLGPAEVMMVMVLLLTVVMQGIAKANTYCPYVNDGSNTTVY